MARDPKPDERKQLRRMIANAGGRENFSRWLDLAEQLPPGKQGRLKEWDDRLSGLLLEARLHRFMAMRDGVHPKTALREWLETLEKKLERYEKGLFKKLHGKNPNAVAERLWDQLQTEEPILRPNRDSKLRDDQKIKPARPKALINKEEERRESAEAMAEYKAKQQAEYKRTARLRAERLARDATKRKG